MTEDEYTASLSRLSVDEVRRVLALELAIRSLGSGHNEFTVTRRADVLKTYIETGEL